MRERPFSSGLLQRLLRRRRKCVHGCLREAKSAAGGSAVLSSSAPGAIRRRRCSSASLIQKNGNAIPCIIAVRVCTLRPDPTRRARRANPEPPRSHKNEAMSSTKCSVAWLSVRNLICRQLFSTSNPTRSCSGYSSREIRGALATSCSAWPLVHLRVQNTVISPRSYVVVPACRSPAFLQLALYRQPHSSY